MHVSRTSAHSTSQVLLAFALLSLSILPATLAKGSTFVSLSSSAPKTLAALISQYGLNQTFSFDQPSRDLSASSAASYLKENWNLNSNKVRSPALLCLSWDLVLTFSICCLSLLWACSYRSKQARSSSRSARTPLTRPTRARSSRSITRREASEDQERGGLSSTCVFLRLWSAFQCAL